MNLNKIVIKYRELFKQAPAVSTAHNDKGHNYVSPITQEQYKSVTFFTSFIKDPSLANFKMNRALNHILENYGSGGIHQLIEEAKLAPEGEFHNAGDIGSQVHAWRQKWFQDWIESGQIEISDGVIDTYPLPENAPVEVISGCRAIKRFLKETGYIPVACELALVDDELKVGGTIDDLGVFPNKQIERRYAVPGSDDEWMNGGFKEYYKPYLGFVDLKTSNQGKKPAYAYQVRGFYQRMIRKTFRIKPKKTYILHTSKEDGTYKLIDLTDMKFLEKEAVYLVYASKTWDKVVESFKPKLLTI